MRNIFDEAELEPNSVVKEYLTTAADGKSYRTKHYNLEAIIAVGYRVRSHRGTQFRVWATQRLREYIVKGFTMDDERLKNPPGPGQTDYFDEQLERIRDIRSSERRFYQKVLDIYATSIDYAPDSEMSQRFFATVQNERPRCRTRQQWDRRSPPLCRVLRRGRAGVAQKLHWAAHGHTAAELVHLRADAEKPLMGMSTTRPGAIVRKADISVAKNYLTEDELHALNRIVNAYLEFAELQAMNRRPLAMRDWITKLDDFLKLSDRDLLTHAGKVPAEAAQHKAEFEYNRYRKLIDAQPRSVDADFDRTLKDLQKRPR